jgi:hypothetical protein
MTEHRPDAPGTGPDDAELVRYLDDELDAIGRARLERQIAADPASALRLETLRRRGRRMAELLASADAHVLGNGRTAPAGAPRLLSNPPRAAQTHVDRAATRRTNLLRAAVIVLALAAAAVLAPPVRALIADGLARLADTVGRTPPAAPRPDAATAADAADPAGNRDGVVFQLIVGTTDFRIDVDSEQRAGALVLRRGEPGSGSAEIDGPAADAELLVAAGTLRVLNNEGATASYVIVLPATVRRVHVRVDRRAVITLPLDGDRRVDLTGR